MTPPTPVLDRIQALEGDDLFRFLASLWRRAGWEIEEVNADPTEIVARRTTDGNPDRTVLYPVSSSGVATADDVQTVVTDGDRSADRTVMISTVGFAPDARRLTERHGADTMGPEGLARIVITLGAGDLLDQSEQIDDATSQASFR